MSLRETHPESYRNKRTAINEVVAGVRTTFSTSLLVRMLLYIFAFSFFSLFTLTSSFFWSWRLLCPSFPNEVIEVRCSARVKL